jgi:hypothetical protein
MGLASSDSLMLRFSGIKLCVCITVFFLLLLGCGVKTAYNNLDLLIPWYVDDLITLNDEQQAALEKRLAEVISWHRTTQLTEYSAFMRKTRHQLEDGVSAQDLDEVFAEAEKSWQILIGKITPELVDILLTASDQQKQELFANIEKQNEEFKKDYLYLSEEQRRQDRVKAIQKNFRRWLGSLNEAQKKTIEHYASNFIPIHNDRWLFRLQWQKEIRKLLYDDPAKPEVRENLEKLFVGMQDLYPQEYKNKRLVNIKLVKEMILQMNGTISSEQFEHLFKRIESYATTFEELAVQI